MKKKMILLIWLTSISFIGFSQDFRKIGIGFGYHTTSIVGDSVRPFELSLRYRIINKHTLLVDAPLWLKKDNQKIEHWADFTKAEHKKMYKQIYTHSLWGIGLGYDYTFYSYSQFNFFTGISTDFQRYEYRNDYYDINYIQLGPIDNRPPVYDDFYKKIETSYYWDRKTGISIIPNTGIRFVTEKIAVEAKLGLYFSKFDMEAFYLGKEKGLFDEEWMGWWKSYYPDKSKQEYTIRPNISIALSYYL